MSRLCVDWLQYISINITSRKTIQSLFLHWIYVRMPFARAGLFIESPLKWRHDERDGVPNHQPHDRLLSRLFRHISKKTSKLRVTGIWIIILGGFFRSLRFCGRKHTWVYGLDLIDIAITAGIFSAKYVNQSSFVCCWQQVSQKRALYPVLETDVSST